VDRGQPPPDDRPKRSPAEGPLSTGHGSGGGRGSVGPAFDGPNNVILPHPGSLSVRFATLKDGFREPAQGSTAAGWYREDEAGASSSSAAGVNISTRLKRPRPAAGEHEAEN
jgi:hypothetical protein